jgi:hypothetical protein
MVQKKYDAGFGDKGRARMAGDEVHRTFLVRCRGLWVPDCAGRTGPGQLSAAPKTRLLPRGYRNCSSPA